MKVKTFAFIVSLLTSSCIEEFKIQETLPLETPDIVIQGRIASGSESVFYLSKTQPIGSEEKAESILNAEITIVGQNGYESPKATFDIEEDCYIINTQDLPDNTLYAVLIKAEGETYQSDFQELFITPSIESVSYKEREDGISIHVTSYGNEGNSPYYLWAYEEDWEFHAPDNINGLKGIPVYSKEIYNLPFLDENGNNPYLYCWGHNGSKHINIYNTTILTENTAKEVELFRIPIDDVRISYIYSILVKQYSLSPEGYQYYSLIKKYSEESSGIFTPIPSEVKGNVSCISNPEIKVLGYVLASTCQTKRVFIYESDFKQICSEYDSGCISAGWGDNFFNLNKIYTEGVIAMTYNGELSDLLNPNLTETIFYTRECIDCRVVKGSTKKRPDFWPTDHE
ncbi:MAG: DUF4249 domain-containing protein [Bacteroides sp.]|nr:DUF4249 domain-containing protein [Bacteroides sp.]